MRKLWLRDRWMVGRLIKFSKYEVKLCKQHQYSDNEGGKQTGAVTE